MVLTDFKLEQCYANKFKFSKTNGFVRNIIGIGIDPITTINVQCSTNQRNSEVI